MYAVFDRKAILELIPQLIRFGRKKKVYLKVYKILNFLPSKYFSISVLPEQGQVPCFCWKNKICGH